MSLRSWSFVTVLVAGLAGSPVWGQVTLDEFPVYKPVEGVSGSLKSIGSDTMNNMMSRWQEGFKNFYPNVQTQVESKGSSTAPPALINSTANFGPMSRDMKSGEKAEFKKKFGYEPSGLRVAIDMIAIYVHKDNPIKSVTLPQLDALFSRTRKAGLDENIEKWGVLGLSGAWSSKRISLYGRNSASGTYGYVKEAVLLGGDFKDTVKEQPGSSGVVQAIGQDRYGIGYSGIGYGTSNVRTVPLAEEEGDEPVPAESEHAYDGTYPLARPLLVYINRDPGAELDALRREFVRYIFSRQGQQAVLEDGYLPVPKELAKEVLEEVGIRE